MVKDYFRCIMSVCAAGTLALCSNALAEEFYQEGSPDVKLSTQNGAEYHLPNFSKLAKILSPAVVNISVEAASEPEEGAEESPIPGFPFFKKDQGIPFSSLGSGFIVQEDGYIVTNNHVVKDAKKIIIRLLDDKQEYEAKVIGRDLLTDLALLKIETKEKLSAVFFGDSDTVEVGEWVVAIGNQFQLGQTVTAGIVSAKSRRVGNSPSRPYDQFLQTDAPINPGSSGGPLFNTNGQVIGINTAIFSPGRMPQMGGSGFNIGIGFAIPINLAKTVIAQLRSQGKVTRGLLGVLIQEIDTDLAKALKLSSQNGALVSEVKPGSPAEKAGFKRRDVIISFNGTTIKDHSDLPLMVANTKIGSQAKVEVLRDGEKLTFAPTVGELKDDSKAKEKDKEQKPKADELGLIIKNVTEEQGKALGIKADSGVIVESVEPGSPADKAKLMRGDIIQEFGDVIITDAESFESTVKNFDKKSVTSILVRRREGAFYLALKVEKTAE